MSYSDNSKSPRSSDIKSQATAGLLALEALHGKEVASQADQYATQLGNALKLMRKLETHDDWRKDRKTIGDLAKALINTAEVVQQMHKAAEAGEGHPLLNCGLLAAVPPRFLARIIMNGLVTEAEEVMDACTA